MAQQGSQGLGTRGQPEGDGYKYRVFAAPCARPVTLTAAGKGEARLDTRKKNDGVIERDMCVLV
jgi:hypothetical protein